MNRFFALGVSLSALTAIASAAPVTKLVSPGAASYDAGTMSGDGTVVVVGDTGGSLWRLSGAGLTSLASGFRPILSRDGKFLSYIGSDLQVHLRTIADGTDVVASRVSSGVADASCQLQAISDAGRYVSFSSAATNLVSSDTNGLEDVFLADAQGGIQRVSVSSAGVQANFESTSSAVSANGRYVAFASYASNLVASDTNGASSKEAGLDVFLRDVQTNTTTRISTDLAGGQANGASGFDGVSMSSDGRFVAFASEATNLVPGDTNGMADVFVKDVQTGAIERASVGWGAVQGDGGSGAPILTGDGRFVTFVSNAKNLGPEVLSAGVFVYVRDRTRNATLRASTGAKLETPSSPSFAQGISADGRNVLFASQAAGLTPDDSDGSWDVFVHDTRFASLPGTAIELYNPTSRSLGYWTTANGAITGWQSIGSVATGWSPVGLGDFTRDEDADAALLRASDQSTGVWNLNGRIITGWTTLPRVGAGWTIAGFADVNFDSYRDLVIRRTSDGAMGAYLVRRGANIGWQSLPKLPAGWSLVGLADVDGDGWSDMVMRSDSTKSVGAWLLEGPTILGWRTLATAPTGWTLLGFGDFDANDQADLLMQRDSDRRLGAWLISGGVVTGWRSMSAVGAGWQVVGIGRK